MEHDEHAEYDDDRYGGPEYRRPETIDPTEMRQGLMSLTLFESDLNMRQQGLNLEIVDQATMRLENLLLQKQFNEEPVGPDAAFLNALSQMWIFAVYELMRTWRQRAGDMIKWADNGGLQLKLGELRKETSFTHFGREMRARQIEAVIADSSIVDRLRSDLRRTHIPFARMEMVRVAIAKHEVRGRKNSVALMPTYGRINQWSGSLDYELAHENVSMGTISRRDIADDLRSLPQMEVPTDETIKSFDAFMKGPTAEQLASLFVDPPQEI